MVVAEKSSNARYLRENRRAYARHPFRFSLKVAPSNETSLARGAVGEIFDVSEGGFGVVMSNPPAKGSPVNLTFSSFLRKSAMQVQAKLCWNLPIDETTFKCGFKIVSIEQEHLKIISEIGESYTRLNPEFVQLTQEMLFFLNTTKNKCDAFDKHCADKIKRIVFVREKKQQIFNELDERFKKIWDNVRKMTPEERKTHQHYSQEILDPLLADIVQTNHHVYYKPLDYPGDYLMMNFIYDYHGDINYIGESSYEMLFNNYTCNIPISCSNIARKTYLKEKILESMAETPTDAQIQILSIASGPAREITELLHEEKIVKPVKFRCLDFESRALDHIKSELDSIDTSKKRFFQIDFFNEDIISVIRNKELKEKLKGQHLIYAFGIYDYLSDRIASRFTKELFNLLLPGGRLIICNASSEYESHRGYYELLGEWNMIYRTNQEMTEWTKNLGDNTQFFFEQPKNYLNYWYLVISKK